MTNKYLSGIIALSLLPMSAFAANDLSGFDDRVPLSEKLLREYKTETPNVVYRDRKTIAREGKWYMGLNADMAFLSGKYKQSNGGIVPDEEEKLKTKPVLGLDLTVGYRTSKNWRFDGKIGYIGKYSEIENEMYSYVVKTELNLDTYYASANAYYDIAYGFYAGLGAGLSVSSLSIEDGIAGKVSSTHLSPMGLGMFGWTYMLDEKIDFDVHYQLALYDGGSVNIGGAKIDMGTIFNNTISAGIRYHF